MHAHPTPPSGGVGTGAPGGRPALRVTDIFRAHGAAFDAAHVLTPAQGKVLRALAACRTAALGGHLEVCEHCGFERPAYNSCRNRHCPGCQAAAQREWLEKRLVRVLPTHHFHVVFTLPSELRELALKNGAVVYDVLLRAAAEVLGTLADDRLDAQLGITAVLHTWTRQMLFHPHVHCVVTGGGLAGDGGWVATPPNFLFPVAVMRKLYRGVVRAWLRAAYDAGKLAFDGDARGFARLLRSIHRKRWVVYAKRPFAEAKQVFAYLGRYTHRVAISDHRLLAVTGDAVTFSTRDGGRVTVAPDEFLRRFLLHVLPTGFHKIRHFGLYAATNVHTRLEQARMRLPAPVEAVTDDAADAATESPAIPDARTCPCCKVGVLLRLPLPRARPAPTTAPAPLDSS